MEPIYSFRVSVHPNQRKEKKIVAQDLQCFIFVTRIHIKVINVKLTRPFESRLENICLYVSIQVRLKGGPKVTKLFIMLNSTEHEIYPASKSWNANNCWHFNINKQDR